MKRDARPVSSMKKLEVRESVVRLDAVDVMDVLVPGQRPPKRFGDDESMFRDIPPRVAHGCCGVPVVDQHVNISLPHRPAATPCRVILSRKPATLRAMSDCL